MADRIAVVTDSTSDLPQSVLSSEEIFMVPLSVFFGDEEFQDGIDLTPEQFYAKLENSPHFPTTAQPAPGLFMELFQRLEKAGYTHVVCLHLSRKFSGTAQSAAVAAKMVPGLQYEVIDTKVCTWGLGALALYARRLVREGRGFSEVVSAIHAQIPRTMIVFALDNLEALARGGRIGTAKAFIGKYLGVRPVLAMDGVNGEIEVMGKTYSPKAACELMVKLAEAHARRHGVVQMLCVLNADLSRHGDLLRDLLKRSSLDLSKLRYETIGCVIGAHVGSTAWGVVLC